MTDATPIMGWMVEGLKGVVNLLAMYTAENQPLETSRVEEMEAVVERLLGIVDSLKKRVTT